MIGQTRYDRAYPGFSPLQKDMDSSHVIPPFADSYDGPVVPVKPDGNNTGPVNPTNPPESSVK